MRVLPGCGVSNLNISNKANFLGQFKALYHNEIQRKTAAKSNWRMSILAITATMLVGSPLDSGSMASPVMVQSVDLAARDQQTKKPLSLELPSLGAANSPFPAESATPPSASANDQSEIVVTSRQRETPGDPLEKVNAKSFAATQAVDKAFVGPVALAYRKVLPAPIRGGLRNVLNNLHEPVVFLNFLLQIKPGRAAETLGRFAVNSTIGCAGLVDVATRRPFRLPRRPNGFADTLGYYGVRPGPFLFLPLVGPTTLRDLFGGEVDALVLPLSLGKLYRGTTYPIPRRLVRVLDNRVEFDEQLHKLRDDTADPYAARREYYLQQRQAEIDELRGRKRGMGITASEYSNPAVYPSLLPALHEEVRANAPSAVSESNSPSSVPSNTPNLHTTFGLSGGMGK